MLAYWMKKRRKFMNVNKISKKKRKVANSKLRIKGKFVTKDQAIKLLGMTAVEVDKQIKNISGKKRQRTTSSINIEID